MCFACTNMCVFSLPYILLIKCIVLLIAVCIMLNAIGQLIINDWCWQRRKNKIIKIIECTHTFAVPLVYRMPHRTVLDALLPAAWLNPLIVRLIFAMQSMPRCLQGSVQRNFISIKIILTATSVAIKRILWVYNFVSFCKYSLSLIYIYD